MDVRKILMPVAATPALQAILHWIGMLDLLPLAHWGWKQGLVLAITYLVSTASAALAWLWPGKKKRSQIVLIVVGLVVLLASFGAYTWISTTPPTADRLWLYDVGGYVSFFLTYISYGFLVGRGTKVFTKS